MSIIPSSFNSPPLVTFLTTANYVAMPQIDKLFLNAPMIAIKSANLLAYAISLYAVSQPGRIDGQAQQQQQQQKTNDGATTKPLLDDDNNDLKKRESIFMPDGYAFSIWAPIFIGELVFVTSSFFMTNPIIQQIAGSFVSAQLFQTLWTMSFRPKYQSTLPNVFVSTFNLAGIAIALSKAHGVYSASTSNELAQYLIMLLPLSLHFGWTTAASLVDLNGAVALKFPRKVSTIVGYASAIGGTLLGLGITVSRQAPVYGGVIAWALGAIASALSKKLANADDDNEDEEPLPGSNVQLRLCQIGTVLNIGASALTALGYTANMWKA
eukprot:CAMPEP_0119546554 /NCGR_PEP_ID=MMETSP1352-20130426/926_1 /TAXON_ID=265584 /ORGANISM="Stauroneis constricta, Strain CCMP1120" /LENGTH=323 /DNA_ID=CAMNT_0007591271 /DNA_START=69 /DNA_END=1040 /DNA_ORIENTATION=+